MIPRERLLGLLGDTEIRSVYDEVRATGDMVAFYRQYHDDEKVQVARNALWALTKATDDELLALQPLLHSMIDHTMHATHSSIRRLTLNLIERLPMQEEDLRTDFLDFCLTHMAALDEPPGVQSLCLKLAHRMCSFYPELMEELHRTLQAMDVEYYTPAIRSVRKKILTSKSNHSLPPV